MVRNGCERPRAAATATNGHDVRVSQRRLHVFALDVGGQERVTLLADKAFLQLGRGGARIVTARGRGFGNQLLPLHVHAAAQQKKCEAMGCAEG